MNHPLRPTVQPKSVSTRSTIQIPSLIPSAVPVQMPRSTVSAPESYPNSPRSPVITPIPTIPTIPRKSPVITTIPTIPTIPQITPKTPKISPKTSQITSNKKLTKKPIDSNGETNTQDLESRLNLLLSTFEERLEHELSQRELKLTLKEHELTQRELKLALKEQELTQREHEHAVKEQELDEYETYLRDLVKTVKPTTSTTIRKPKEERRLLTSDDVSNLSDFDLTAEINRTNRMTSYYRSKNDDSASATLFILTSNLTLLRNEVKSRKSK